MLRKNWFAEGVYAEVITAYALFAKQERYSPVKALIINKHSVKSLQKNGH